MSDTSIIETIQLMQLEIIENALAQYKAGTLSLSEMLQAVHKGCE